MKRYILAAIIILAAILRFYKLGLVPPSLYWDEVSLGYNAYSILKTAHDEHGVFLPKTNFAEFGDYKPPGYIYAAVPAVAVFGLNEFAVRFPSAFFGVLTVLLVYFLTKKLFKNDQIAFISSFFLAISPWHIQFSRGAFEANLGLFFSTLGIYLFLKFAKDHPFFIFLSALSFLAAMYTFTGQRLFVPFILLVLVIHFRRQVFANLKIIAMAAVIAGILFWPLFIFATRTIEGQLRFNEVTIFKDLEPINQSIRYREKDNFSWWSAIIHNRRLFYAYQYLTHYFDAFNPGFLFINGDVNPRLSPQEIGELYLFDLILVLMGLYFLLSRKYKHSFLLLSWLLISPLGPATARETPHALRMIHILPTFQIISAIGVYHLFRMIKYKKMLIAASTLIVLLSLFFYLHMYYLHWSKEYSGEWQYGYKEAVEIAKDYYNKVDRIVVTKSLGRPYIYFLFYTQYDPKKYIKTVQKTRDQFFFLDVERFDKFIFTDNVAEFNAPGKTLYIANPGQLPSSVSKITTILNLKNEAVFDIGIAAR